jgi:hypothetical protein
MAILFYCIGDGEQREYPVFICQQHNRFAKPLQCFNLYFIGRYTEIPWEQMIGLRHVLVHGYYTIKPKQLWNIIEKDIPVLMPQIKQLLDSEKFTEE